MTINGPIVVFIEYVFRVSSTRRPFSELQGESVIKPIISSDSSAFQDMLAFLDLQTKMYAKPLAANVNAHSLVGVVNPTCWSRRRGWLLFLEQRV